GNPVYVFQLIGISLLAVSTGFIFHELAHRLVARKFGYYAEYEMWPAGLLIALVSSLMGFIFAAPGAVVIRPGNIIIADHKTQMENLGLISIAGPATNIAIAVLFLVLDAIYPTLIFYLGAYINTWLAIFNLIPFGPLDGAKIFRWSKLYWGVALAIAVLLYILQRFAL
ncbi:MAG: site-2 protease family protein, partial [Dehalococcoidales bacterium]|nr:site-2 protease family protein [Dehalococcoidales bacterium]